MHWIENALANVNIEALNDVLRWTIGIMRIFNLDVGTDPKNPSVFETTIPVASFLGPIATLAMIIVIFGVALKLYIAILSPYGTSEEPAMIVLRGGVAVVGVYGATRIFVYIEKLFNEVYQLFVKAYTDVTNEYTDSFFGRLTITESSGSSGESGAAWQSIKEGGSGFQSAQGGSTQAFNLSMLGGENLINPENATGFEASLGILILELIIGCTLIICFFRLVLEVYERYVLLGVMYITSPLAFASIVSKDAQIFKNWFQMLVSQYILLCTNLIFIGGFIKAWYNIISDALDNHPGYMFFDYPTYIETMFILIGWLIIGQKLDQHLKGLGLSTAQTGAGIMGALAGGAVLARTALGAAGAVGGGAHRAATGQTMTQRAWRERTGIPGAIANTLYGPKGGKADKNISRDPVAGPGKERISESDFPIVPGSGEQGSKNLADEHNAVASFSEGIQKITDDPNVAYSAGADFSDFKASEAQIVSQEPASNGSPKRVVESGNTRAHVYGDWEQANREHPEPKSLKQLDLGDGKIAAVHLEKIK